MSNTSNQSENKPIVAFIDDDERILSAMEKLFRHSHQVFCTTDPNSYIDFIKNNVVHVAVSDQRMPARLGVDILSDVKDISPHTMRILLTGYADLKAILGSINEGEIFRYLTKPFDADHVLQVIHRACDISKSLYNTPAREINTKSNVTEPKAENTTSSIKPVTSKPTVLALDNKQDLQDLQEKLGDLFNFKWASTPEEAYEHIENNEIHVLISDIQIDGENIAQTIYSLKEHAKNIVVLVQTDIKDATQLIDLINKGQVYRVLPKPVRISLAKVSIERAYKHHLQLTETPLMSNKHEVEQSNHENPHLAGQVSQAVNVLKNTGYFDQG